MFGWFRKLIKKKTKQDKIHPKRWRYAPDGITKINVGD